MLAGVEGFLEGLNVQLKVTIGVGGELLGDLGVRVNLDTNADVRRGFASNDGGGGNDLLLGAAEINDGAGGGGR